MKLLGIEVPDGAICSARVRVPIWNNDWSYWIYVEGTTEEFVEFLGEMAPGYGFGFDDFGPDETFFADSVAWRAELN